MAPPRTYKTHGIVLKYIPLGEADRIVTIYSRNKGSIRAVARGVRRSKSRLRGHLELLTHVAVSIAEGRSLDVISEADSVNSFRGLRENLRPMSEAVYMADLVNSFSADSSANMNVFDLFLDSLDSLEEGQNSTQLIRYFEVQLLMLSGFGPELERCVECNSSLEPCNHVFSSGKGGITCPSCKRGSEDILLPLSINAIKVLRYFQRSPKARPPELSLPTTLLTELQRVLRSYIHHILERDLKSVDFMSIVAMTEP